MSGLIHAWPEQPRPLTSLQAFGVGCAAFDLDNDGWQDVLLVAQPHPRLFRNSGHRRFVDVTAGSGLDQLSGDWRGCAVGDYDGDGLLDLLITGYHGLALCRNLGNSRFANATVESGLDPHNLGEWGSSAGFMDLDGDQWLDLVILNYVVFGPDSQQYCEHHGVRSGCNPRMTYPPERGRIWRNTGTGRFEAIPQEQAMAATHGLALVVSFSDFDDDGRIDFYVGNDGVPADLLHNQGAMTFHNTARVAGLEQVESGAVAAMGSDLADFDRDGRLDLAVTNWQGLGAVLFRGLGQGLFFDQSQISGLTRSTKDFMGFGLKWIDFENDGWPDLFLVNGHVYDNSDQVEGPTARFRQPLNLLVNVQGRRLVDVVPALPEEMQSPLVGRGSATADFDNDGRVDLLAVDLEGPVRLFHNETETTHHWLKLDLRGKAPNTFGYGARLVGRSGTRVWRADLSPASSYLSSSDPRIHWGLGDTTTLETLTIRWPDGTEQTLNGIAADQIMRIDQPK
ncbi:MAG: CRTAC1 family protein [Planctomycetes bacterium]|nr:CRTAC1 family protein [Planctomycetota bacterium]